MTTVNIDIELGFHWARMHVKYASDIIHLHNIEQIEEFPPYNNTLESKEFLVPEPRSTPSSTPISTTSNSLVMIRNC